MLTYRRLLTTTAVTLGFVGFLGMAEANATPADDQFLGVVANLGITFASPADAIAAGQGVCTRVANGLAAHAQPAMIRSSVVGRLRGSGLDDGQAANLMWSAVDVYCPQYNSVVGD